MRLWYPVLVLCCLKFDRKSIYSLKSFSFAGALVLLTVFRLREKARLLNDIDHIATVQNIERILTRLVSRDFEINRDIPDRDFGELPVQEKNALAFHVLMVSLWVFVCVSLAM